MGKFLTADRVERARRNFARYGYLAILVCRFLPGVRAPTFFAAGLTGISMARFMLYDTLAALVSVSAFCSIGYVFADNIEKIMGDVRRAEHWLVAVGIVLAVIALPVVAFWWQRSSAKGGEGGASTDGSP